LGDTVVEKWLIRAEAGSRIPLALYRPRQATGRLPAVVMTCGHGGSKSTPRNVYVARLYAAAGVACLLADPLGEEHSALLTLNGDADDIIDHDRSGAAWRDTAAHLAGLDAEHRRLRAWFCPQGWHRPYHGARRAMRFIHEQFGTPAARAQKIEDLPELRYGDWYDRHGIPLEPLYGVERHYRGALLPDTGLEPIPRESLAVLPPQERGGVRLYH